MSIGIHLWPAVFTEQQSGQFPDAEAAKLHGIRVAGQSKMPGAPVFAGVRMISHEVGYVAQIGVEYGRAVEFNLDR